MMKLEDNDEVIVYRSYYFYDGPERVDLDWGIIGHIPNQGDTFEHPKRNIGLRLGGIVWGDGGPDDP